MAEPDRSAFVLFPGKEIFSDGKFLFLAQSKKSPRYAICMVGLAWKTLCVFLIPIPLPCASHYPAPRTIRSAASFWLKTIPLNSVTAHPEARPTGKVHMTMINFKRTGGTMGKETTMNFDLDGMPGSVARRLQSLLTDSNFFDVPVINDLRAGPDEFQYDITVIAGNSIHTVHVSDTSMPQSLRPLIEELTELAETAA
jgi:hypothetical protein